MSTPALDRATEALAPSESRATKRTEYGEMSTPILLLSAKAAARAAVPAALHDPDDPDWLKRVVSDAADSFWDVNPLPGDEYGSQTERLYAHVADAVRGAILGEAS